MSLPVMPDVLLWAELLKLGLGDVAPALRIAGGGGVHDCHVNICAETIDWISISLGGLAHRDILLTEADITPESTLLIVDPLHESTNLFFQVVSAAL